MFLSPQIPGPTLCGAGPPTTQAPPGPNRSLQQRQWLRSLSSSLQWWCCCPVAASIVNIHFSSFLSLPLKLGFRHLFQPCRWRCWGRPQLWRKTCWARPRALVFGRAFDFDLPCSALLPSICEQLLESCSMSRAGLHQCSGFGRIRLSSRSGRPSCRLALALCACTDLTSQQRIRSVGKGEEHWFRCCRTRAARDRFLEFLLVLRFDSYMEKVPSLRWQMWALCFTMINAMNRLLPLGICSRCFRWLCPLCSFSSSEPLAPSCLAVN